MTGWRTAVITIVSTTSPQELIDVIKSRTKDPQKGANYKNMRYIMDKYGVFYWSDRYDKNYIHIWELNSA